MKDKIKSFLIIFVAFSMFLTGCSRQSVTDFTPKAEDQARVTPTIKLSETIIDIDDNHSFEVTKAELIIEKVEFEHWDEDGDDDHHHHHHSLRLSKVLQEDERGLFAHTIYGPITYNLLAPSSLGRLVLHHETHLDIDVDIEKMHIEGTITRLTDNQTFAVKIEIEEEFEFEFHGDEELDEDSDVKMGLIINIDEWFGAESDKFDILALDVVSGEIVIDADTNDDEIEDFIELIHEKTSIEIY